MIRLGFKVLTCDRIEIFNYKYLKFLESETEADLMRKHQFGRKECREYFKLVNFTVNFLKYNIIAYLFGIALGLIRVFYVSYSTLSLKSFLLFSLPNGLSLGSAFVLNYLINGSFYTIFWLDCIFLNKKIELAKTTLL